MSNRPSLAIVLSTALCGTQLLAAPVVRKAHFDPEAGPNQYTIEFPVELSGETVYMPIVGGSFEIETDAEAGTSKLLSWRQEIAPIQIFGMSTGPITVTLDPASSSEGTYDAVESSFAVTAGFRIEFDDTELQQVGFVSPVVLTATESGTFHGAGSIGSVSMFLEGTGDFAGGSFSYTCQTTASYDYLLEDHEAQPGDVNHDRRIDISDPVAILGDLFLGSEVACRAAAEVNRDDSVDLADAVFLLNYLYLGGPSAPVAPVACFAADPADDVVEEPGEPAP